MGAQQSQTDTPGKDEQRPFDLSDEEKQVSYDVCSTDRCLHCKPVPVELIFAVCGLSLSAAQRLPVMSWSTLSASRASSRVLVAVHGVVYDVGDFAPSHPGGREVLTAWAGSDASAAFQEAMHPDDTWHDMKEMAVATLQDASSRDAHSGAQIIQTTAGSPLAQPAEKRSVASLGSSSTADVDNRQTANSSSKTLSSADASTVRCLIVHGSQTGAATSQAAEGSDHTATVTLRLSASTTAAHPKHCRHCLLSAQSWRLVLLRTSSNTRRYTSGSNQLAALFPGRAS